MEPVITSRDNQSVKQLAGLLSRKKERDESGCFVAEGLRLCLDAAKSNGVIRTALLTQTAARRHPQTELLIRRAQQTLWLEESLAARVGDTATPQGVFAICEKLDNRQCAVTIKDGRYYLLASQLQDPGNLGALLRTAEAMGIEGVFLSEDCADLYAPKVLRGAMGATFRLPVALCGDLTKEIAVLKEAGVPVYAAALTANALTIGNTDFSGGGAMLIGNEGNGLSPALIECCTAGVRIPMTDGVNSLNAVVAAGILLWEMRRGRC